MEESRDKILVLDCGSQVSHLICRRCREVGVYSELMSITTPFEEVKKFGPKGIIISGGPDSVYEEGAPQLSEEAWKWIRETKLPVLGICYGLQLMIHAHGGKVGPCDAREYGHSELNVLDRNELFEGVSEKTLVWMSHGDKVIKLPSDFKVIATTSNSEFAAVQHTSLPLEGLQFHPEVTHSVEGTKMIGNWCSKAAHCGLQSWNMADFCQKEIEEIRATVGDSYVLGAVSGGVDSSVGAALLYKAVGAKFRPFLIDTGFLRKNEADEVRERLSKHIDGMQLRVLDWSDKFLAALEGITEPEAKRKAIGRVFIDAFQEAVEMEGVPLNNTYLLQGTLYPDVIESTSFKGPSSVIKSHHNVGGLPDKIKFKGLMEPLRLLFKDEVRALGKHLGLPEESVMRHPFPGPGLAIRIIGAPLCKEYADILREADAIFLEEIRKSGDYAKIGQAFTVLCPNVKTVGVMGDQRTYEMVCCLRAVASSDFMTADWYEMPTPVLKQVSARIINEVRGINRVLYDISSKPPSTIEWE